MDSTLASRWARLIRPNCSKLRPSRRKSCTVAMPVTFSCRNALIRAICSRTRRYDSRAFFRNQCVTQAMAGRTAKTTSARRQSIQSSTSMMPASRKTSRNTVTTPEANSSFRVSTSEVTRVISRPTGLRS